MVLLKITPREELKLKNSTSHLHHKIKEKSYHQQTMNLNYMKSDPRRRLMIERVVDEDFQRIYFLSMTILMQVYLNHMKKFQTKVINEKIMKIEIDAMEGHQ